MQDYEQAAINLTGTCDAIGLTVDWEFVPFSKSRNAQPDSTFGNGKPWESINWKATLKHNGREILRTDYSQGLGHAPAMKAKVKANVNQIMRENAAREEIESGMVCKWDFGDRPFSTRKPLPRPSVADLVSSLAMDSDVLDHACFDDWAESLGYDTDSRKAESIYRATLEHALALRNSIGNANLVQLQEYAREM